ncbi:MAG: N-acetylmuramoyl-L-alanine amidase [Rhodospirillaceae bacterium]
MLSRRVLLSGVSLGLLGLLTPGFARSALALDAAGPIAPGHPGAAVRLGDHGSSARMVLEMGADRPYAWAVLPDPYRLVLDLPGDAFETVRLPGRGASFLRAVRSMVTGQGTPRLVVDLAKPALMDQAFLIAPRSGHGWRLVLDLVPTTKETFMAALGSGAAQGGPALGSLRTATAAARPAPVAPTAPASPAVAPQAAAAEVTGAPLSLTNPQPIAPRAVAPQTIPTATQPVQTQPSVTVARPDPVAPVPIEKAPIEQAALEAQTAPAAEGPNTLQRLAHALGPDHDIPIPQIKPPVPASFLRGKKRVVILDPGHGGRDPGAIGGSGIFEKQVTLEMARTLRKALEATGRYKVVMTRNKDVSVRLRERVSRARHAGGDLFISLHADALRNPKVRGLSVYTLSENASDAEAQALAERENKADIILGLDLSHESKEVADILIDLAQRETKNRSVTFANTLIGNLPHSVTKLGKTRRFAGFAVLKAPDIPSVLVEMGFLSNGTDEKLLRTAAYQTKLARSIAQSVDTYFLPQTQSAFHP